MTPPENSCLWAHSTQVAAPVADDLPAGTVDVAVIGAGLFGLSTARALAERGLCVAVIEKDEIGAGASGRNGGQVQAGFGSDASMLASGAGSEHAAEIATIAATCADHVFDLAERYAIQCDPVRTGLIRAVHHPRLVPTMRARAEADPALEWWNRDRTSKHLGTTAHHGAIFDPRAGRIEPLGFTRGLARAAQLHGATLLPRTPATAMTRKRDGWHIDTPKGSLRADRVVLATNTYTDALSPPLRQSLVAVNSFQIATAPFAGGPLRGGEVASDTRRLVFYYRRDAAGRLIVGGRGTLHGTDELTRYGFLRAWLARTYPDLAAQPITHFWAGRVGITTDHIPHLHMPDPGLFMLCGFNGKGVALATAMGDRMARHLAGEPITVLGLHQRPLKPIPFWRFRNLGVSTHVALYRLLDGLGR